MRQVLTTVATLILVSASAHAFKPAPPPASKVFKSPDGAAELTINSVSWQISAASVRHGGKTHIWTGRYPYPRRVFVSARTRRVVFLGTYGGACAGLGQITVYDFDGKFLKSLNAKALIPNLKTLSRSYTRICCPCFWVHRVTPSADGRSLKINVCDKTLLSLSLTGLKLSR